MELRGGEVKTEGPKGNFITMSLISLASVDFIKQESTQSIFSRNIHYLL